MALGLNAGDDGKSLTSPRAKPVSPLDKENLAPPANKSSSVFRTLKAKLTKRPAPAPAETDFFAFQRQLAAANGIVFVPPTPQRPVVPQKASTSHLRHWR